MPRPGQDYNGSVDTLADRTAASAATASGTGTPFKGFARAAHSMKAQLVIDAVSGTLPTLDVVIEESMDGVNWFTLATFTRAAAATSQMVPISLPFCDQLRARWTIGGTSPSFSFAVKIASS